MPEKDVNKNTIHMMIDNKEYTSDTLKFYMDDDRNIMVPVDMLREALNCSARIYQENELWVEKHSLMADYMLGTVRENTHHGSLVIWVRSFN